MELDQIGFTLVQIWGFYHFKFLRYQGFSETYIWHVIRFELQKFRQVTISDIGLFQFQVYSLKIPRTMTKFSGFVPTYVCICNTTVWLESHFIWMIFISSYQFFRMDRFMKLHRSAFIFLTCQHMKAEEKIVWAAVQHR